VVRPRRGRLPVVARERIRPDAVQADSSEGIEAVMEKREPKFEGR
jgi:hypothetical protein